MVVLLYHCQLHLGLNLMHHIKCGGITHPPYVVLYLRRLLALVPSSYTIYVPFSLSIKMATNDRRRMVLLPSPPSEYFRRSFIFAPSLLYLGANQIPTSLSSPYIIIECPIAQRAVLFASSPFHSAVSVSYPATPRPVNRVGTSPIICCFIF